MTNQRLGSRSMCEALEVRRHLSRSFFVSLDGPSNGDGSASAPWRSIGQVNAYAAGLGFQGGDHILFHGGQVFPGQIILLQGGVPNHPIVVASYDWKMAGDATIDAGDGSAITARNIGGIMIARLKLLGSSMTGPKADASVFAQPAAAGDRSLTLASASGLTPGQQIDIDRSPDAATGHAYEEAYVAPSYVPGSLLVPLLSPLLFGHAAGAAASWDVHFGVAFVADDGAAHADVRVVKVEASGFGGVWPSAGVAFLGNGLRDGRGSNPRTKDPNAFSVGNSGFSNVSIHDCVISGSGPTGILVAGFTFSGSSDTGAFANDGVRITHDVVGGSAFPTRRAARVDAAMQGPPHPQPGESGVLVYDSRDVRVEHVESIGNGRYGAGGAGVWAYRSDGVTITHSESAFNRTAGRTDGNGFDLDGGTTHSIVEYSYSHDNDGAAFALYEFAGFGGNAPPNRRNVYRYNVSENDGRRNGYGAVSLFSPSPGNVLAHDAVYNNTIYLSPTASGTTPPAVLLGAATTDVTFRNNIFYVTRGSGAGAPVVLASGALTAANALFQRNDYYAVGAGGGPLVVWGGRAFATLADWEQTGQEMRNGNPLGLSIDPGLADPGQGGAAGDRTFAHAGLLDSLTAYRLGPSSLLFGVGLNLTHLRIDPGTVDFYGDPLPLHGGYSIGADQ